MKKVLQIATLISLNRGGAPYSTRSINNSINGFTDHSSELLILGRDRGSSEEQEPNSYHFFNDFNPCLNKLIPFSYGLVPNKKGMKYLEDIINSFDLIMFHQIFSISNIIAAGKCRKLGKKYVIVPHGSLNSYHLRYHWFRKKLFLIFLGRNFIKGATAIICASELESSQIRNRFDVATEVLGLGTSDKISEIQDTLVSTPTCVRDEYPSFLFIGRITPKKLVGVVILAFAKFQKQFPQARLIIAGSGKLNEISELKRLVREHSIEASVSFLGWVEGAEKAALFREVRFGILISKDENFGVSIAESLSFGQPVIVSEGVALSETVRRSRAGIVTTGLDVDSVLFAMEEVNRMNFSALCENAKFASKSLKWESVVKNWDFFLNRIR